VVVAYESAELTFQRQLVIVGANDQMFSDGGDSGSIILQRSANAAVALLFAGSSSHTIASPIAAVLRSLRVTMA
jgi:hypothetical protein